MKKISFLFLFITLFALFINAAESDFPIMGNDRSLGALNYTTAYYGGGNVNVGFDGTNYLVLWEWRDSIFGNLISPDGTVIDGKNIYYNLEYNSFQYQFNLFFDGEKYLLVFDNNFDLSFLPIHTDNNTVQPDKIAISSNFLRQNDQLYTIGFDGKDFLVLHGEYSSEYDNIIVGYKFSDGKITETAGLIYGYKPFFPPPLVFNGDNYFTIWWNDSLHAGWISNEDGELQESGFKNTFEIDLEFGTEKILYDETGYLLIDEKYSEDNEQRELSALKILKDGEIGDNKILKIGTLGKYSTYHASFDGEYYNFFLIDIKYIPESDCGDYDNYLVWVRVNKTGEISSKKCLSSYEHIPGDFSIAVAYNGNEGLLAFNLAHEQVDTYGGTEYINSIMLDLDKGSVKSENFDVTKRPNRLIDMDIAFDGTNFMAVWVDDENDIKKIYGSLINTSGETLNDTPFLISSGEVDEIEPSIAFNGKEYMTVWSQEGKILGKRISTEGTVISSEIEIYSEELISSPVIASDGEEYFLTWLKTYENSKKNMIFGMKISEKGAFQKQYLEEVSEFSSEYSKPEMIFDGENFFLIWMDYTNSVVYGLRVSKDGTVLDKDNIPIVHGVPDYPKVIYNGEKYVVFSKSAEYIIAKTVEKDGTVNKAVKTIIDGIEKGIDVVYDGTNYLVVYEDYSENSISYKGLILSPDFNTLVDTFDISTPFEWENNPYFPSRIWSIGDRKGNSLIFYRIYSSENQYSNDLRIYYRSITSSEAGSPCSDSSSCRSGFCIDEVCCKMESCDDGNPNTEDTCSDTGECTHEMIYLEPDNEGSESSGCSCIIF